MRPPKTILVPTDFSAYGDAAIEQAVMLAKQLDATVHLLNVVTFPAAGAPELGLVQLNAVVQESAKEAQSKLDAIANRLRDQVGVGPVRVEVGDAREVIDRVASELDADLIVMGTHGRRGISRWFLGSIAESVVRTAPCPVLTVHREAA